MTNLRLVRGIMYEALPCADANRRTGNIGIGVVCMPETHVHNGTNAETEIGFGMKPMALRYTPVPEPSFEIHPVPMDVCDGRIDYMEAENGIRTIARRYERIKDSAQWETMWNVLSGTAGDDDVPSLSYVCMTLIDNALGRTPVRPNLDSVSSMTDLVKLSQEQLDALVAQHKVWLYHAGFRGHRLSLEGYDLTGLSFADADISQCRLVRCKLRNTDMSHAKIDSSEFRRCDMSRTFVGNDSLAGTMNDVHGHNALFDRCVLDYTSFERTELSQCWFVGCSIEGCAIRNASMTRCVFDMCSLAHVISANVNWSGSIERRCVVKGMCNDSPMSRVRSEDLARRSGRSVTKRVAKRISDATGMSRNSNVISVTTMPPAQRACGGAAQKASDEASPSCDFGYASDAAEVEWDEFDDLD